MRLIRHGLVLVITACAVCASLIVPAHAAVPGTNESWEYSIVKGDTLIGIAAQYLGQRASWRDLQRHNNVRAPRRLIPGTRLRMPVAWLRRNVALAEVLRVQGNVRVGKTADTGTRVITGSTVRAGDVIHTAVQSTVTLRFVDGSRLLVVQNSRVTIEQLLAYGGTGLTETRLRVDQGGTDSSVTPPPSPGARFEIQSPTMHLGVRGTEFRVRVDPTGSRSHAEVLRGQVAASGAKSKVLVDAGFGTQADATGVPDKPRALVAAPDLRAVAALIDRVPIRLSWPALSGAQGYRAQVFANRKFDELLLDGVFQDPVARWSDLPDGSYVLRVRALAADGFEGLNASADFVLKARPEPPFVRQPGENAKIYGDTVTLEWARHLQAARYRLQVSDSPVFAPFLIDDGSLTDLAHSLQLAPGRYYWRMATIRADGDQGPLGDAQSFELLRIPESPALEAPAVNDEQVQMRWGAGEPGMSFQFQFAADPEFKRVLLDKLTSETEVALPRPGPGKYYMRVKSIAADGFAGPFGTAQEISIAHSKWWLLLPAGLILWSL